MRLILSVICLLTAAASGAVRNQAITLVPGWNAVWLEVEPQAPDGSAQRPETVFAAVPQVSAVARFLPARSRIEFIQDPSSDSLGADFWLKWRRNTMVGGNTLTGMKGNSAYLIQNSSAAAVNVTLSGQVSYHRYEWIADSFHLFGVPVGAANGPAFTEFFGPSGAHPLNQVFKLSAGKWVAAQAGERIQKNAAYWVYCRGGSSYQGPVPVLFPDAGGYLEFGESLTTAEFSAGNLAVTSSSLTIRRETDGGLGLFDATGGGSIVNFAVTAAGTGSGTLATKSSATVRLEARRTWNTAPAARENLYTLNAGLTGGSAYYQYLPVRGALDLAAVGPDLPPLPGLWIGDAVLTQATSLVAGKTAAGTLAGPRPEPVKRPLRYRVILHVDAAGQARLLEHATLMKKRQVSEDLPEEFVVVVDDTKIPAFTGIEERDGKLVGKRFDTAAYDLPRTPVPAASLDNSPSFDPSTLSKTYLLSLPLTGSLAPGGVVTTQAGTLVMDPWHRTNPYRHVFNPEHRKGFRISREMRFEIDAAGSSAAVQTSGFGTTALSGIFEETVQGLTKPGDASQLRGRFILQRISSVAQIQ